MDIVELGQKKAVPTVIRFKRGRPPAGRLIQITSLGASIFCIVGIIVISLLPSGSGDSNRTESRPISITGRASVIDGDTIEIHGVRIRLYGIDAPESDQTCLLDGVPWRCGQKAAIALADKIGAHTVACEAKDRDVYGRTVAICRIGKEDLNAWMAVSGWALAYRHYSAAYVRQEQEASQSKAGIWQSEFIFPWDWRHDATRFRGSTSKPRNSGCDIKGNINWRGEHIYHVPGGAFYSKTFINPLKGERWFCTEREAISAGWRKSKR